MNIFVLEDNAMRCLFFYNFAMSNNHKMTVVNNAPDARKILSHVKYDLICLDHDLGDICPDNNGVHVCEFIGMTINNSTDILIHSWNAAATDKMVNVLHQEGHMADVARYEFETDPFYAYLNKFKRITTESKG